MAHRARPIVLLVDGHEDSAAMYAISLLAMGFEPVTAETADEAFYDACLLQPDVIVADVRLARDMDLMQQLRGDARTSAARIIVLTSEPSAVLKDSAAAAGCDRYLVKPCLPDILALEVQELLGHHGAGSTSS